ncbi:hypothetical protein AOQ84DRAFT_275927, partial [Glonium stellatum]
VELGYLLLPFAWGNGYATESVESILKQYRNFLSCFNQGTETNIQANVHLENTKSIRVLEKLGFQEAGRSEGGDPVQLGGSKR